jgi:biopolymer transport protein ExbD
MAMSSGTAPGAVMCDINTTPLIDVMLVLLVTLIISLPVMTHAVKLDMPNPNQPPPQNPTPPEVIDLEIDSDGTIAWNGSTIAGVDALDGYFHQEAVKDPQPEIHLRPEARAKYGVVARVLAAAQRNHMQKIGFTNVAEYGY